MSTVSSLSSATIESQVSTYESRLQGPITVLDNQQTTDKADISAWAKIKGGVSSLSSALAGISDPSSLTSRAATSTSSGIATVTANNSAPVGTYNITDVTLAKAQIIYSGIISDVPNSASAIASAGSLVFSQNGKTETVKVGAGSLSASSIAKAINAAAGGVEASVVTTQGGARLVLQSSATGSSQAFTVSGKGGLSRFSYSPSATSGSFTSTSPAQNATLDINGVPVSYKTNTVSSAVAGLTINLASSSPQGSPDTGTTIKVTNSPTGLTTAFASVASSLSSAISSITSETKYTPATKSASASGSTAATAGPLIGNFSATDLQSQLLSAVSGAEASGISAASIGLTVSSAGAVSFSNSAFESAYASNPTAVQKLVTDIYTTLNAVATEALGSANSSTGGTIGAQTSALSSEVSSITTQVAQITKDNNESIQILLSEYSIAEATASNAAITETYLSLITNPSSSGSGF